MKFSSFICRSFLYFVLICSSVTSVQASTVIHQASWSLFSAPGDAPVQDIKGLSPFDSSLGNLTQVSWSVNAGLDAMFQSAPTTFPVEYSLGAVIGCGVSSSVIGPVGCDIVSSPLRADSRVGTTLPFPDPVGVNEIISLGFLTDVSFTDPAQLAFFTDTSPILIALQVQTHAQAQTCLPNPLSPGSEICSPVPVNYFGDYTGTFSLAYTYDPVSAIPLPAGLWLFGTALIGLAGYSRRRKTGWSG